MEIIKTDIRFSRAYKRSFIICPPRDSQFGNTVWPIIKAYKGNISWKERCGSRD